MWDKWIEAARDDDNAETDDNDDKNNDQFSMRFVSVLNTQNTCVHN